jgi:hypothetical protein
MSMRDPTAPQPELIQTMMGTIAGASGGATAAKADGPTSHPDCTRGSEDDLRRDSA